RERCAGAAERWDAAWSAEQRASAAAAFAALGDHADASWQRASAGLDEYGMHWQASHRETCLAAQAHALDARMGCLQRAHASVDALGDLLVVADEAIARNAVKAVEGLPNLQRCDRIAADASDPFAPHDPASSEDVRVALDELARVEATLAAGRHADALAPAEALVAEARALDHGPLLAESLFVQGRAQADAEQYQRAIASLEEAEHAALAHGHDELVPVVINQLVYVIGYKLGRNDDALAWGRHGLAAAERVAVPAGPRGRLLVSIGNALEGKAETAAAKQHYLEAIDLLAEAYGDDSPYVARAINSLGNALYGLGEMEDAGAAYRRAHAIWSAALGDEHPDAVIPLTNMARIEMMSGRLHEGKRMLEHVLDVWTRAYGPRHSWLTIPLSSLAEVTRDLGDYDAAIAYDLQALALYEATLGPEHPNTGFPIYGLGMAHFELERYDEAEVWFRRALAVREKAYGPQDPRLCLTIAKLALIAVKHGQKDDAIALAERALAIGEHAYDPQSPNLARLHHTLAEVLMDFDEPARALPHLERTLALRPGNSSTYHPDELPLFELAKVHHALGGDPVLVTALAEAGAMRYAAWPEPETAAEIRRWIAQRR
ncbi:MAG TPA: tetratricopeptide repeat protein, partial [Nannocystaceae bacterium]|nr:tetratricopeptide repeat protein [Nannocystaceae bacterium]